MNTFKERLSFLRIRYSPHPIQTYVRSVDKFAVGPGCDPRLTENLAAWNIYWLSYPNLEAATDLHTVGEPIYRELDPLAGAAVETASQNIRGCKISELATLLPALTLIELLTKERGWRLALSDFFGRELWLDVMDSRARAFSSRPATSQLKSDSY